MTLRYLIFKLGIAYKAYNDILIAKQGNKDVYVGVYDKNYDN